MSNVNGIVNSVRASVSKHSPEILTGIGITGLITATVLAVKATPKAIRIIEALKDDMETDKPPALEVVKATWKCYIPAATTTVLSVACIVGASSVNARRNAALAAAYKLSETALIEYKDAVIETVGEKKAKDVRDKVAEKQIEKNPVSKNEVIITDKGNTLCYDSLSGRYFKSDIEKIRKAENVFDRRVLIEEYASLNEFYDELNLEHTQMGDNLGWRVDYGTLDITFSSQIAEDGTPCIVMHFGTPPRYGYSSLY